MRRRFLGALVGSAVLAHGLPFAAHAQDWPSRPMTMIVPFAAGGPVDTIGRIMAARLSQLLGQQIVIENVGGAGGMTGAARAAKAAPDGYTVLLSGSAVLALNQLLYKRPLYNALTDFEHVALFSELGAGADHAQGFAAEHARGIRRLRQGEPGQDAIRLGGRRLGHACLRRAAQRRHGHQDYACTLSRLGPRHAGPDRPAASTSSPSRSRPRCRRSAATLSRHSPRSGSTGRRAWKPWPPRTSLA